MNKNDIKKLNNNDLKEFSEFIKRMRSKDNKQKLMITMREGTICELDKLAKQEHKTRSGCINEAVDLWIQMMTQINMLKEKKDDKN